MLAFGKCHIRRKMSFNHLHMQTCETESFKLCTDICKNNAVWFARSPFTFIYTIYLIIIIFLANMQHRAVPR